MVGSWAKIGCPLKTETEPQVAWRLRNHSASAELTWEEGSHGAIGAMGAGDLGRLGDPADPQVTMAFVHGKTDDWMTG